MMVVTAYKGARLERFIINRFVTADKDNRIGVRSRGSFTDIDFILIDRLKGKIILGQAKNFKRELGKVARENILKPLNKWKGHYEVEVEFFGKEEFTK